MRSKKRKKKARFDWIAFKSFNRFATFKPFKTSAGLFNGLNDLTVFSRFTYTLPQAY